MLSRTKLLIVAFTIMFMVPKLMGQSEATEFTLEEAQSYAKEHNLKVKNALLEIESSNEYVKEIRAIGLPQVNISADFQNFVKLPTSIIPGDFAAQRDTNGMVIGEIPPDQEVQFGTKNNINVGISANQLLFDSKYLLGLEAAKLFVSKEELESQLILEDNKFEVADAYYNALVSKEKIDILKTNLENLNSIFEETEALNKSGFVEELDVDRLKLSISNLKTEIVFAERAYNSALEVLKLKMGHSGDDGLILMDKLEDFIEEDMDIVIDQANVSNRVENRLFDLQANFDDLDIKQVKWEYIPSLALFGSAKETFQAEDLDIFGRKWFPTVVWGLQLNMPIFDGLSRRSRVQQRLIKKDINQNTRADFNNSFDFKVKLDYGNYVSALEQYENLQENVDLAKKIYDVTLIKYKEGLGSSLEVNAAEAEYFRTQGLYINAMYTVVMAKNILLKTLGNY